MTSRHPAIYCSRSGQPEPSKCPRNCLNTPDKPSPYVQPGNKYVNFQHSQHYISSCLIKAPTPRTPSCLL